MCKMILYRRCIKIKLIIYCQRFVPFSLKMIVYRKILPYTVTFEGSKTVILKNKIKINLNISFFKKIQKGN